MLTTLGWKFFLITPGFVAIALFSPQALAQEALAEEAIATKIQLEAQPDVITLEETLPLGALEIELGEPEAMSQVTSVSQLSDVQPTDWAFQALQSLVERYGIIAGYPDGTFRGNRTLTRYEFAAGLNAALDQFTDSISTGFPGIINQQDLVVLQRLQDEFSGELAILRGRMNVLEARATELEVNQFSTTTRLTGEAILSISNLYGSQVGAFGDDKTVFQYRSRLNFITSFTGRDTLYTRFAAGTFSPFTVPAHLSSRNLNVPNPIDVGTAEGSLVNSIGGATNNSIVLDRLTYSFTVGDRLEAYIAAHRGEHSDYVFSTVNPYFEDFDGGNGSISTFGQRSPIYRIGGGTGAGFNVVLDNNQRLALSVGYLAEDAANPSAGSGLFNGDYSVLSQLTVTPSESLQIGLTYVHAYHSSDNAIFDSGFGGERFLVGTSPANAAHIGIGVPAVTNSYGIQASWEVNPRLLVNAFGGYTDLSLLQTGSGEVWYYGLGLAFPDLFQIGNLGGILIGAEPYLSGGGASITDLNLRTDSSLHVEAFYNLQLNDNISITPGLIWITAPEQNSTNDSYFVGTLRTTFRF